MQNPVSRSGCLIYLNKIHGRSFDFYCVHIRVIFSLQNLSVTNNKTILILVRFELLSKNLVLEFPNTFLVFPLITEYSA